jgi:hypothetical protein
MASATLTPAQIKPARQVIEKHGATIIKNLGRHNRRVLIGIPTLGVVRIEWDIHRRGQVIPINWQSGEVTASHLPPSVIGMGYSTADAQNVCLERAYLDGYEWFLLWEDDVLPPFTALVTLSKHMDRGEAPMISGLYYSKGNPSWPLVFRGRGNGAYTDWSFGDHVWCDGVPTGFLLIHHTLFRWMWEHATAYKLPDGRTIQQVFQTPRDSWFDPEQDRYFAKMGTSDLYFCDQLLEHEVLAKTGWTALAKKRWPFLVDTTLFCRQIDLNGVLYPDGATERLKTAGERSGKKPLPRP